MPVALGPSASGAPSRETPLRPFPIAVTPSMMIPVLARVTAKPSVAFDLEVVREMRLLVTSRWNTTPPTRLPVIAESTSETPSARVTNRPNASRVTLMSVRRPVTTPVTSSSGVRS